MASMTHRTTFALDEPSAIRLKRLAARWRVSQAEVVRRSLEQAEQDSDTGKPDAITMLRRLHENAQGMDPATADEWLAEIREDRKHWRRDFSTPLAASASTALMR